MKVLVWEQFSSNHSANFTIVGTFDSASTAQKVANTLRDDIRRIIDWYSHNESYRHQVLNLETPNPTPVEKDIATRYGINHEQVIDFLANSRYHDDMVKVFKNHVFVSNGNVETFTGPSLFDQLMMKLGADIALEVEGAEAALVDISCEVPNEKLGKEVMQQADLIDETYVIKVTPWIVHHPMAKKIGDFYGEVETFVEEYHTEPQWLPTSMEDMNRYYQMHSAILDVSAYLQQSRTPSGVDLSDHQLNFRGVSFSKISVGLPAFLTWLTDKGCENISHRIYQAQWNLPPGMSEDDL